MVAAVKNWPTHSPPLLGTTGRWSGAIFRFLVFYLLALGLFRFPGGVTIFMQRPFAVSFILTILLAFGLGLIWIGPDLSARIEVK